MQNRVAMTVVVYFVAIVKKVLQKEKMKSLQQSVTIIATFDPIIAAFCCFSEEKMKSLQQSVTIIAAF